MIRDIKHWWQRRTRGFDDSEIWSLDYTISAFVLPRLIRYREVNKTYPQDMTMDQWNGIIDQMIRYFNWECNSVNSYALENPHPDGLKLFCQYYKHLWW